MAISSSVVPSGIDARSNTPEAEYATLLDNSLSDTSNAFMIEVEILEISSSVKGNVTALEAVIVTTSPVMDGGTVGNNVVGIADGDDVGTFVGLDVMNRDSLIMVQS